MAIPANMTPIISPMPDNPDGFTHKVVFKYTDLQYVGGDDTDTDFLLLPIGTRVSACAWNLKTPISNSATAVGTMTAALDLGVTSNEEIWCTNTTVSNVSADVVSYGGLSAIATATNATTYLTITLNLGTDTTATNIAAGELEVYYRMVDLNKFEGS